MTEINKKRYENYSFEELIKERQSLLKNLSYIRDNELFEKESLKLSELNKLIVARKDKIHR